MKYPAESNGVHEGARPDTPTRAIKNHEKEKTDFGVRSDPLKSTYNSTFIILVLSIAALLALILIFWPFGGF